MQPGQRPTSSASRSAAPSEDTVARAPGSTAAPRPEPAAPDPATTQVPPAPVSMDGPAPSRPGTRPTGLSARLGRRLRWGGLARRRDTTWLPAEPADDPTAPPPAEDTPVVTVRAPVATGFLLATGVMLALSVVWVLQTNGQLLVWSDWAGFTSGRIPKFVKQYAQLAQTLEAAAVSFREDVASGSYPAPEHEYE